MSNQRVACWGRRLATCIWLILEARLCDRRSRPCGLIWWTITILVGSMKIIGPFHISAYHSHNCGAATTRGVPLNRNPVIFVAPSSPRPRNVLPVSFPQAADNQSPLWSSTGQVSRSSLSWPKLIPSRRLRTVVLRPQRPHASQVEVRFPSQPLLVLSSKPIKAMKEQKYWWSNGRMTMLVDHPRVLGMFHGRVRQQFCLPMNRQARTRGGFTFCYLQGWQSPQSSDWATYYHLARPRLSSNRTRFRSIRCPPSTRLSWVLQHGQLGKRAFCTQYGPRRGSKL